MDRLGRRYYREESESETKQQADTQQRIKAQTVERQKRKGN